MARLYLVRRNLESFLGPMTVDQLAQSYERMDFGLQDEVGGHCGKWVPFDDLDELEKHYPELSNIVRDKMLGGWGVSEHTATRITKVKNDKSEKRKSPWGFIFLIVFFGSAAALAAFLFANQKFSSRVFQLTADQDLVTARQFLSENRVEEFQEFLDPILQDVTDRARRSRKNYHNWIPYLRAYAFLGHGSVEGFPPRLLRGMGVVHAPQDCSLRFWSQQWRSQARVLSQATRNDALVSQPWLQLLSWDPFWIRRRNTDDSWIYPQSYYEGCLIMAKRAWDQLNQRDSENNQDRFGISARLDFLLSTIRGQIVTHEIASNHPISSLTCIDKASQDSDLSRCNSEFNHSSMWQEFLERRRRLSQIRLILDRHARHLDSQGLTQISSHSARLLDEDPINQFDYRAELRFYRALLRHSGNVNEAARQVGFEFKDVNFLPARTSP